MESSPRGKSAFPLWLIPKAHYLEEILYDNKERGSVAETLDTSEENSTTLTPSVRTTMNIVSDSWPEKKLRGKQIQSILTNLLPHNNITYKKNVV